MLPVVARAYTCEYNMCRPNSEGNYGEKRHIRRVDSNHQVLATEDSKFGHKIEKKK